MDCYFFGGDFAAIASHGLKQERIWVNGLDDTTARDRKLFTEEDLYLFSCAVYDSKHIQRFFVADRHQQSKARSALLCCFTIENRIINVFFGYRQAFSFYFDEIVESFGCVYIKKRRQRKAYSVAETKSYYVFLSSRTFISKELLRPHVDVKTGDHKELAHLVERARIVSRTSPSLVQQLEIELIYSGHVLSRRPKRQLSLNATFQVDSVHAHKSN